MKSLLAILATALLASGCTVVKPVVCAVWHPIDRFGDALDRPDDDEDDHAELPAVAVFAAAPVLIPLNYVYLTVFGAVGGLYSGFVSDLNVLTGNANSKTTMKALTRPLHTNALPPEER